jgi:hypothetical protein
MGLRFEEVRQRSYDVLAKVQEKLRSDWVHDDTGPSHEQVQAMEEARRHLAAAKAALSKAAPPAGASPASTPPLASAPRRFHNGRR